MLRKMIALTAVAGAAALAAPGAAGAATADSSATRSLRLRAGLTLEIPATWRVYGTADRIHVVTGACRNPRGGFFEPGCRGFWVLGPKALRTGAAGFLPYDPDNGPFYPASDVAPCPADPRYGQVIGKAIVAGRRKVGVGHRAQYRVWPGRCVSYRNGAQRSTFRQREWYLPKERILVVDQWATPGLATILRNADWVRR